MAQPIQLVFVHGWSVTHTDTYGELPEALVAMAVGQGLSIEISHLYLGRYISFHDGVTLDDVSRAFNHALRHDMANNKAGTKIFSCITHSTGGPVVRNWVDLYYGAERLDKCPLRHLVMLAPANHGSALAALGKARVGRIKAWASGVEPGQGILDWLSLASDGQWDLNGKALAYDFSKAKHYPFVLSGESIDEKFYDFLNSYLVEKGSDGVVRLTGANMNYRRFQLRQSDEALPGRPHRTRLSLGENGMQTAPKVPLGVVADASHSGTRMGIMASVKPNNAGDKPVVDDILQCLKVQNRAQYEARYGALRHASDQLQQSQGGSRYSMIVFSVTDGDGNRVTDYDLLILAGKRYDPNVLPKGFFVDRQKNQSSRHRLCYYVDYDRMSQIKDGKIGFRVVARPQKGFSHYVAAEFRSEDIPLDLILRANETVYVDIVLNRVVDRNVFRMATRDQSPGSFKKTKPADEPL